MRVAAIRSWVGAHRRLAAIVAVVVALAVGGSVTGVVLTSSGGKRAPAAAAPRPTPPPPSPLLPGFRPSPHPAPPPVDPLTGQPGTPAGPVVGVKIDNTAAGMPQWGLDAADVVYLEQAEGGLTRLLAVFDRLRPTQVGPVRSVRGSDPELLAQYGRIGLAFSGGAAGEVALFHASPLVDASFDAHPDAYRRLDSRPAPYNLVLDMATLSRDAARAAPARDVGFRWAARDPRLAAAARVTAFTATVGSTPVSFRWDAPSRRWQETIGGSVVASAEGPAVSTPNVLVQFCSVTPDYTDIDVAGNPAAYTHSIGGGRAILFRDGRRLDGTWSRPTAGAPTRFRTATGADLVLRPGGVWVVLAAAGSAVTVG